MCQVEDCNGKIQTAQRKSIGHAADLTPEPTCPGDAGAHDQRIDELGDASVPFEFDVHGLIFSENTPALEAKLHEHFYKSRINKLNDRKEFFKADILEIEKVVKENYDKVVDIVKDAPAEQYRESLLIE